jgi:hypothetical protein
VLSCRRQANEPWSSPHVPSRNLPKSACRSPAGGPPHKCRRAATCWLHMVKCHVANGSSASHSQHKCLAASPAHREQRLHHLELSFVTPGSIGRGALHGTALQSSHARQRPERGAAPAKQPHPRQIPAGPKGPLCGGQCQRSTVSSPASSRPCVASTHLRRVSSQQLLGGCVQELSQVGEQQGHHRGRGQLLPQGTQAGLQADSHASLRCLQRRHAQHRCKAREAAALQGASAAPQPPLGWCTAVLLGQKQYTPTFTAARLRPPSCHPPATPARSPPLAAPGSPGPTDRRPRLYWLRGRLASGIEKDAGRSGEGLLLAGLAVVHPCLTHTARLHKLLLREKER